MLRRAQKIVLKDDPVPEAEPADPAPAPQLDRRAAFDRRSAEPDRNVVPIVERRQAERRAGLEALRAEALKSVISRVEDRNFGGIKSRIQLRPNPKGRRLILLAVALGAGGLAAFLAVQREPAPAPAAAPVTEVVREARVQVLVARGPIAVGQRLTPETVGWEEWPEDAVRPEYITIAAAPDAATAMAGAIVRSEFYAGEPIRPQKLATGEGGFLSAVLDPGMRGVSVAVSAASASGGFIVPNDRVDVVLTRTSELGPSTETVLANVRVLAINAQLGEAPQKEGETGASRVAFVGDAIATLELDEKQAEIITNAVTLGRLSLAVRSMGDAGEAPAAPMSTANQLIRMTSPFWQK